VQTVSQRADCHQRQYLRYQAKRSPGSFGPERCWQIHYFLYLDYGILSLRWPRLCLRPRCDRFRSLTLRKQNGSLRLEQPALGQVDSERTHEHDRQNQGSQQLRHRFPARAHQADPGSDPVREQAGRPAEWRQQTQTLLRDLPPREPGRGIPRRADDRRRPDLPPQSLQNAEAPQELVDYADYPPHGRSRGPLRQNRNHDQRPLRVHRLAWSLEAKVRRRVLTHGDRRDGAEPRTCGSADTVIVPVVLETDRCC